MEGPCGTFPVPDILLNNAHAMKDANTTVIPACLPKAGKSILESLDRLAGTAQPDECPSSGEKRLANGIIFECEPFGFIAGPKSLIKALHHHKGARRNDQQLGARSCRKIGLMKRSLRLLVGFNRPPDLQ